MFTLTPEDQLISDNITANKGKLPWPVEQGIVIQRFGKQPHPVVKTAMIQSNGVTIATPKSSEARAVFEGKVMSIIGFKGSNPTVLIQHGNYITTYSNLGEVYVIKGQKVKAKEKIGKVFTNPSDVLGFSWVQLTWSGVLVLYTCSHCSFFSCCMVKI